MQGIVVHFIKAKDWELGEFIKLPAVKNSLGDAEPQRVVNMENHEGHLYVYAQVDK